MHATLVPIVVGERRKSKKEKTPNTPRLCADDIMNRVNLKAYQKTYAERMSKYGLERGIEGSTAQHISAVQYSRDLLAAAEVKEGDIAKLQSEKQQIQMELSKIKGEVRVENFKGAAADVGTTIVEGFGSFFGTSKVKNLQEDVVNLKTDNQHLKKDIKKLNENIGDLQDEQEEHKGLIDTLNSKLEHIYDLFPNVKELIIFEKFCRAVGFGTDMIRQLFNKEKVSFKGEIYSHEYKRNFKTNHSIAKIEPNPKQPSKFQLNIDGLGICDWFRQKQREFLLSIGISSKVRAQNKGIKL